MAADLEARLLSHARAFEGLMSLIPAKQYYGEDNGDQWQRKKQTKEQKRQAKKAVLNPESHKSAKDVLDENERKRKLDDMSDLDVENKEKPLEGVKVASQKAKKQKLDQPVSASKDEGSKPGADEEGGVSRQQVKAEKRREKREQKKARLQSKKASKTDDALNPQEHTSPPSEPADEAVADVLEDGNDMNDVDFSGIVEDSITQPQPELLPDISASPTPTPGSPLSAISLQPSTSSSSSIIPPASVEGNEKAELPATFEKPTKAFKLPKVDHAILQGRLKARIEELRAARKADGIDGKPARNRQELMDARRRKEEQRKAHKKEIRKQAKEDEKRAAAEAELARLRGSGSPLTTPDVFSPRSETNNFSFGRIAFDDGQQMDSSLSNLLDPRKKKGPQDPRTALEAAKKKQARINGFDETKKADIEEKDAWLNARKRAHGERVRDDTSLLMKTLKRKEKGKLKSEKDWNERIEGVAKGKEMRQKKREDNLRKRKEEKGSKGKGKPKPKSAGKTKGRPGFEGRFGGKAKAK